MTMREQSRDQDQERGALLLVIAFVALATAGLAAIHYLLFNPPPNFVEVPRPVVNYAPIFLVRNASG